jgi:nucleoside-diphosphate-sugar epimerase
VLNLARGRSVSPRELVARLVEISGVPAELRSRRIADGSAALRGGPGGHDVDPAEAMTALDWRPRYRHVRTLRAIWQAAGRAATGTRELDARA